MRFDVWTLALQTVNFIVLVWLLRHFLYKPVLAVIARRQGEVDRQLKHAASVEGAAAALQQNLTAQRAAIAGERERALAEAHAQAEADRAALLAQGRAEAEKLLKEARHRLDRERADASEALTRRAAELAIEIARRLLAGTAASTSSAFLVRICARIRAMPRHEQMELEAQVRNGGAVRVVSAAPLPAEEADTCRRHVRELLGDVVVDFADDPGLIAGVELHFPHAVLRDNWRDSLADILPALVSDGTARRA
jgi:F-type H+-transporting ATPase subunit b